MISTRITSPSTFVHATIKVRGHVLITIKSTTDTKLNNTELNFTLAKEISDRRFKWKVSSEILVSESTATVLYVFSNRYKRLVSYLLFIA